jgi:hypothetical protein
MPLIRTAALIAAFVVGLCSWSYARGPGATSVQVEALAASVRDNPGSYKPSYSSRTGFVPLPASRGGGSGVVFVPSGRSRSGGGYRSGK